MNLPKSEIQLLFVIFAFFLQPVVLSDCYNKLKELSSKIDDNRNILQEILDKLNTDNQQDALVDVAFGKNTRQSSTYRSDFTSQMAVDGTTGTFSATDWQKFPHWEVDLGKVYDIKQVEVFLRTDCCGDRFQNIAVTIGPSHNKMSLCNNYVGPSKTGAHIVLRCKGELQGRYVMIARKQSGGVNLELAEVKVMASGADQ